MDVSRTPAHPPTQPRLFEPAGFPENQPAKTDAFWAAYFGFAKLSFRATVRLKTGCPAWLSFGSVKKYPTRSNW